MIKILEGENSFVSKQRLDFLVEEYFKKNPDSAYKIIDASITNISEIINEYETQDMFCTQKLIVVKRLLLNKDNKELIEIITSNNDSVKNINVIIWEDRNIPKNTKYYKTFKKINALESYKKFDKRSFYKWAREKVENEKLKLDQDTLKLLMEMTDYNPYLFTQEIEKLKLTEKDIINIEDIKQNINDNYNDTIWNFIDSINEGSDMKKHTKILMNLLENGLDPHYLMIMIARNIKMLLLINEMQQEKKTDKEMISILKIPPFTFPKLKKIAERSHYDKLLNTFEKIYNLNYETKVGNIEPELGLILLVTRLN